MGTLTKTHISSIESNIDFKTIETDSKALMEGEILKASETGLVNCLTDSNLALIPKLIVNDYSMGSKVLNEIMLVKPIYLPLN